MQGRAGRISLARYGGWVCPRCKGTRYASAYNGLRLWECLSQSCRHQCSSIVGTIFEKTKLPLTTWFLAIYLVTQSGVVA
ncbi:MAG: hypothetical protein VB124_04780 [Burkholderia sp.]